MRSWPRRQPPSVDAAIAFVAFVGLLADLAWAAPSGPQRVAGVAFAAVMAGSLAWRRRAPLSSYVAGSVALALQATFVFTSALYPYVNLLGIYSAALYSDRRRAPAALLTGLLGVAAFFVNYNSPSTVLPLMIGVVWTGAWTAGVAVARRRDEAAVLRDQAVREAASDERQRIARELHDLIGHTVNVMVVQAGAARRVLDRDPDRARTALQTLEHIGRGALDELDRVLGILRNDTGTAGRPRRVADSSQDDWQPLTGLTEIPALVERFGQAGLAVTSQVEGQPAEDLPRSIEVSAYRIVQEALTNTLKHAAASRAQVAITHGDGVVEIVVDDDGVGATGAPPGRGLTGMAERVAVFGGRLEHGGHAGGFRVRAVLPVSSRPDHPVAAGQ